MIKKTGGQRVLLTFLLLLLIHLISIALISDAASVRKSDKQSRLTSVPTFEREVDSDIELVCELSQANKNEIKWRRINGVSLMSPS